MARRSKPAPKPTQRSPESGGRVRLKPQDSFDLIRLLARSQSDARKAVGELVQNSLDAGALHVEIAWLNERGVRCLRIRDDGGGVFPALPRDEALRKIAQTIGHSHKHALSPAERHRQMVLGKYGIGLLGFWCVSEVLELRSRVGGGEVWVLRLLEDGPEAEVFRARAQAALHDATFTEITLRGIKEAVARQIRPPRLQAFLASELRGQLLERGVEVAIHDRVARGRATKEFRVRPKVYLGMPLPELDRLAVPGHDEARVELYFVPADEERRGVVSLACGGTTVLDDIALVDPTDPGGAGRAPWTSGRFEGVVDFADLEVAPGSRRGFVPNEAALEFLIALEKLERQLDARLQQEQEEHARLRRENVAREIRKAFTSVARRLPQYDLFDVRAAARALAASMGVAPLGGGSPGDAAADALADLADKRAPPSDGAPLEEGARWDAGAPPDDGAGADERGRPDDGARPDGDPTPDDGSEPQPEAQASLFPPGPLASVRIAPATLRLPPGAERGLRARALDADGRQLSSGLQFAWSLEGPGQLVPQGAAVRYRAADEEAQAQVRVLVTQAELQASATADVHVREGVGSSERTAGIPEPEAVSAPSESWRSRIRGARWEYNRGHRDYLAVQDDEPRRLRYLIHLFAKEVVLRNFGSPQEEELLERMVEVLTHLGDGRRR